MRFIHPIAAMAVELQTTTFIDRRTVDLHNRYDEIQRARWRLRVERNVARRVAAAPLDETVPTFFRRQAL